jgi:hypothetical protein
MFTAALPDSRLPIYISVLLLGADRIENTVSLLLLPLFVFTELLPGNALIKSITTYYVLGRIGKFDIGGAV